MNEEDILVTQEQSLYAMKERTEESEDALTIVMLEGELVVDIQKCGSCKPKRLTLTSLGSNIYIPPKTTYRLRNNQMVKARWIQVHLYTMNLVTR